LDLWLVTGSDSCFFAVSVGGGALMARATQISVSLPNRRGELAKLCRVLADKKVNILAISVAENSDMGTVRLVVSDADAALAALQDQGLTCARTEVLVLELPNKVGVLADAAETLRAARVNIDYVYGSTGRGRGKAMIVVGTANLKSAEKALSD